jgi:hypothetical protein
MRQRRRDSSFLVIAALAGIGGVMAIAFAIAFPLWAHAHHRSSTPAFMLFAAWGIAALGGAWACIQTYLLSSDPNGPRGGGVRLRLVKNADAVPPGQQTTGTPGERAA